MVAATQGERRALLTASAVRCAASRGLRRRRKEGRGTQKSHGKNEWRNTKKGKVSSGEERESVTVVGKDGGRERYRRRKREGDKMVLFYIKTTQWVSRRDEEDSHVPPSKWKAAACFPGNPVSASEASQ